MENQFKIEHRFVFKANKIQFANVKKKWIEFEFTKVTWTSESIGPCNGLTNDWNVQIEWKKRWRSGMFLVNLKRKPFQNVSIKGMREILPSHHFAARISCWLWCILHLKKNIEIKKCSRLNRYGPKKIRSISQYHKFAFFTMFFSYKRNRWKY